MIELRFLERIDADGTCRKILQQRIGACYPWVDVPCYTLEQQNTEKQSAARDAIVNGNAAD
ncbi:MAG: hypothetical protein ACRCVD_12115 [Halioglobus sp.]